MASATATSAVTPSVDAGGCEFCGLPIPTDWTHCPHCGRPQLFPNVRLADRNEERTALLQRYNEAIVSADHRGCRSLVEAFQTKVLSSHAVMVCAATKLLPIVTSIVDIYATFHDLESLRIKRPPKPGGVDWNAARPKAEIDLLGSKKLIEHLHYANLSINDEGLSNYGDCTVVLRDAMISHRASIFQENTGMFFSKRPGTPPLGYRSTWQERDKLSVAKLCGQIDAKTTDKDFASILCRSAPDAEDDDFIEVQVFGPMTLFTFESVAVRSGTKGAAKSEESAKHGRAHLSACKDILTRANVTFREL